MKKPLRSVLSKISRKNQSMCGIALPQPMVLEEDAENNIWREMMPNTEKQIDTAAVYIPEQYRQPTSNDEPTNKSINEINLFDQKKEKKSAHIQNPIHHPPPDYKHRFREHQQELQHLSLFCVGLFSFGLLPYTSTALADYRPWVSGEKPPLVGLWYGDELITESQNGSLVAVSLPEELQEPVLIEEEIQQTEELAAIDDISFTHSGGEKYFDPLEARPPAVPEGLFIPDGALDKYFAKLALIESNPDETVIARALVWGDSTIANDGIIKNIRKRMQGRFGDSGPGFLAAQVDPRWSIRRDIVRKPKGNWSTKTIVFGGGNDGRYGLAGTVSTALPGSQVTLGGIKVDGERQDLNRFQVLYQTQPGGGQLQISTQSKSTTIDTASEAYNDGHYEMLVRHGDPYIYLTADNSPVTLYGVALEKDVSGVTWETFGVAGSSVASMQKQQFAHISDQIKQRDPALLVYWTGGNELGYPSVRSKTGKVYKRIYRNVVRQLRAGAPEASCLLIGPLDQAVKERGAIISKPTLDNIIRFQREVAAEEGCAYWDARAVMGGANSFNTWLNHEPAMASPDLAHLTGRGRHVIGETFADVMLRSYEVWKIEHPNPLDPSLTSVREVNPEPTTKENASETEEPPQDVSRL